MCSLPAVCEEATVSVSGAVTSRGWTCWSFCLEGLPVEGCAIQESLLLPARCQRTPVGATMRGVLPANVSQTVTSRHRTSAGSQSEEKDRERDRCGESVEEKRVRGGAGGHEG